MKMIYTIPGRMEKMRREVKENDGIYCSGGFHFTVKQVGEAFDYYCASYDVKIIGKCNRSECVNWRITHLNRYQSERVKIALSVHRAELKEWNNALKSWSHIEGILDFEGYELEGPNGEKRKALKIYLMDGSTKRYLFQQPEFENLKEGMHIRLDKSRDGKIAVWYDPEEWTSYCARWKKNV
jgi:hypothetical protein